MVKDIADFDHDAVNREFMVNMILDSLDGTIGDPELVSLKAEPHYMNSDDCGLGTIEDLECIGAWTGGEVLLGLTEMLEHVDSDTALTEWTRGHPDIPETGVGSDEYIGNWEELGDEEYSLLSDAHRQTQWDVIRSFPWDEAPQIIADIFKSGEWPWEGYTPWKRCVMDHVNHEFFDGFVLHEGYEPSTREAKDYSDRQALRDHLMSAID